MLIFLLIVLLVAVVILLVKVSVTIEYVNIEEKHTLNIKLYILKIPIPIYSETPKKEKDTFISKLMKKLERTKSKQIKKESDQPNPVSKFLKQTDKVKDVIKALLKYLRYKIHCSRFELAMEFGFGDAAVTAISVGAVWAAAYDVFTLLSSYIKIENHSININPCFSQDKCDIRFYGIFGTRVIHIINMIFMTLVYIFKAVKSSPADSDRA